MTSSQRLAWLGGNLLGGVFLALCSQWQHLFEGESRLPTIMLVTACWLTVGAATYVAARERERARLSKRINKDARILDPQDG